MKQIEINFGTRKLFVKMAIRHLVNCYRMYFQKDNISAKITQVHGYDFVIEVYCLNDDVRASLFMCLDNLLNERVWMQEDSIFIGLKSEHCCVNKEIYVSENNI